MTEVFFFLPYSYSFQCENHADLWHVQCQDLARMQWESVPRGNYWEANRGMHACCQYSHKYNTVTLVFSVTESVLEMTTVGSAFKVDPKAWQLSPS